MAPSTGKSEYTDNYLRKVDESLKAAQLSLDNDCLNVCVSRAYYAMFQTAIAALIHVGVNKVRWEHSYVQAQVAEMLIKRQKLVSSAFRDALVEVLKRRRTADYDSDDISKKQADRTLRLAQDFVKAMKRVIQREA